MATNKIAYAYLSHVKYGKTTQQGHYCSTWCAISCSFRWVRPSIMLTRLAWLSKIICTGGFNIDVDKSRKKKRLKYCINIPYQGIMENGGDRRNLPVSKANGFTVNTKLVCRVETTKTTLNPNIHTEMCICVEWWCM